MTQKVGLQGTLGFLAGIMALTAMVTLLIPETKGLTLDQIEQGVPFGEAAVISSDSSVGTVSPTIMAEEHRFDKQAVDVV